MEKVNIAILMATYNGGKFLRQQIDSIVNQTFKQWDLFVHDDGSIDNTMEILNHYTKKHQNIHLLSYKTTGEKGAMQNFMGLLERVDADMYMFADQDDVWLPNKIEMFYETMIKTQCKNENKPILIYSDSNVTDSNLNIVSQSFIQFTGNYPQYLNSFEKCGVTSFIPGCCMMINDMAKHQTPQITKHSIMHDIWIHLSVLKNNGVVVGIHEPLMYYRQHQDNTLGANDAIPHTMSYRLAHIINTYKNNKERYLMLKDLGYGSFIKYLYYKLQYKFRIALLTKHR